MSWFQAHRLLGYILALTFFCLHLIDADVFLVRPGDGNEFVYSPININATLYCVVNDTVLFWTIDRVLFIPGGTEAMFNARGIFQMESTASDVSDGMKSSIITVFGDNTLSNIFVCCVPSNTKDQSCTTLIIYDLPPPPNNITLQQTEVIDLVNISWIATTLTTGVMQTYKVTFDSEKVIETVNMYYVYNQSIFGIRCVAYVQAVNGAGESDPSNNVTIPSLPDIEPVTASLTHQVWKSNGHIMVNVSFEEARYCTKNPVLTYVVILRPQAVGESVEVAINGSETWVELGPDDGVRNDHQYIILVTAVNAIGKVTSNMSNCTVIISDLQAVNVSLVNEITLNVQCMFIMGSDSLGCSVLTSSYQSNVNSVNTTLSRKQGAMYASGHLNLTHKSHCYDRVLAFNIDKQNTTSTFSVETELPGRTNITCSDIAPSPGISVIVSLVLITVIVIIVAIVTAVLIVKKVKVNNRGKQVSASAIIDSPAHTLPQKESHSEIQCSTLRHDNFLSPSLLDTHQKAGNTPHSLSPALPDNNSSEEKVPDDPQSPSKVPIYAVPDKSKKKNMSSDCQSYDQQQKTNISSPEEHDESNEKTQHIYHVLENTKGQDTTDKDHDTHNSVLHCPPDKTRMKSNPDNDECVVLSTNSASGNREQKESVQDHIYHVLEQGEIPDITPLSPSHDAPQLPPPFDPDNFTPAPVYQDITELQTK